MKKSLVTATLIIATVALLVFALWFQGPGNRKQVPLFNTQGPIELSFGHDMPENSAQHVAALKFADIVQQRSKGRVRIKIYPDEQLGTDEKMIEMARRGELAIILPPTAKLSGILPEIQCFDIPFLFGSRQDVYQVLDGAIGKEFLNRLASLGLVGVTFWESGFKQFTANKEIRTPEDLVGLRVRIMKSALIANQFNALGAKPIPINFKDLYRAMENKVVDAQENSLVSIVNRDLYKVQSHLTISNHGYLGYVFAFSKEVLDSLSPDIKNMLIMTARELTYFERKEAANREKEFLDILRDHGTQIHFLREEERAAFVAAVQPVVENYQNFIDGTCIGQVKEKLHGKSENAWAESVIVGLDADLTLGSAPAGLAIKRGMEIAAREINQGGGVLGKSIKIVARDHGGVSSRGLENIKVFARTPNLVAVMGGLHSPVALAELDLIHEEKILYLGPWAAATGIVKHHHRPNFVFRASVRDEDAGPFLVSEAFKKYRRMALLLENTAWGRSNYESMTDALKKRDLVPVAVEWFNWGQKDMAQEVMRIEKSGAQVILLVANAPEGASIIKALAKRSIKVPVVSHWGVTGGYFWEEVHRELSDMDFKFLQSFSFLRAGNEATRSFARAYCETYSVPTPEQIPAPVGTAHAYDLMHLLAKAIKLAGTLDRSAIRDTMERLGAHQGLVKNYDPPFTSENHDAFDRNVLFLATYDSNGYIVPIVP